MRLVICDPHPMLLEALSPALRDLGHDVTDTCADPMDLPELAVRGAAEVCLVEPTYRGRSRMSAVSAVRRRCPGLTLVVLTAVATSELWRALDTAVIDAVVSKSSPLAVVDRSVCVARRGQRLVAGFHRAPAGVTTAAATGPDPAAGLVEPLTPRELQVLGLLADGLTTRGIAAQLVVSPNTVRTHVATLFRKLGVHDRGKAVSSAVRGGLL